MPEPYPSLTNPQPTNLGLCNCRRSLSSFSLKRNAANVQNILILFSPLTQSSSHAISGLTMRAGAKRKVELLDSGNNQRSGSVPIIDPSVPAHRGDFFPRHSDPQSFLLACLDFCRGDCRGSFFSGLGDVPVQAQLHGARCERHVRDLHYSRPAFPSFPLPHSQLRVLPTHSSHDCAEGVNQSLK